MSQAHFKLKIAQIKAKINENVFFRVNRRGSTIVRTAQYAPVQRILCACVFVRAVAYTCAFTMRADTGAVRIIHPLSSSARRLGSAAGDASLLHTSVARARAEQPDRALYPPDVLGARRERLRLSSQVQRLQRPDGVSTKLFFSREALHDSLSRGVRTLGNRSKSVVVRI